MAAPTNGGRKKKRRSFLCCFGSCFGSSTKVSADQIDGKPVNGKKPVVDDHDSPAAAAEIVSSSKEIHVVEDEEEKRISLDADRFVTNDNDKTDDATSEKIKTKEESRPIKKQNSKGNDTWTHHRKLSHSASLPPPRQQREAAPAPAGGEFDSIVGAVILMVTLVVMVIWGKICAIICMAAWFYFIPRFRTNSQPIRIKNGESDRLDLDSKEYKKMVVLQGFLHRNQRL